MKMGNSFGHCLIHAFIINENPFFSFSFTDDAYKKISLLPHLRFLDLCGAQVILHCQIYPQTQLPNLPAGTYCGKWGLRIYPIKAFPV